MGKVIGLAVLAVIVIGVIAAGNDDKDGSSSSASPAPDAAFVNLVSSKSACVFTGVSDVYTGDGRVLFTFTLENTAADDGSVSVTPVRHYDDGETNESAMDTMDVPVPGDTTKRYSSEQLTYEAHAHEVVSCGVRLDGGTELPIKAIHI